MNDYLTNFKLYLREQREQIKWEVNQSVRVDLYDKLQSLSRNSCGAIAFAIIDSATGLKSAVVNTLHKNVM